MPPRPLARLTAVLCAGLLTGCSFLAPLPDKASVTERLAAMPTRGLPLERPVTIHWDQHQIPFIEAQTDRDLGFALGMVHAHLRLGQMELLRRVSQGRLAEMAGPLALDIDVSLRLIDFGRVAEKAKREMPAETRAFTQAFVDGINHYQGQLDKLPHEFRVLGLAPQPWTIEDVITVGRLAGTDVNWLVWFRLIELRDREDWPRLWAQFLRWGADSVPSFGPNKRTELLEKLLKASSRNGSNSVVVAGSRTQSGAALIANDPHLGISVPNLWLIAGIKSPSYHAVGLMVPGLPFIAVGRNPWIGWGGTNMRAASSDLYDVSTLAKADFSERTEKIRIRWLGTKTVKLRETPVGPVISDAPPLEWKGVPFALRWIGHERGDEITALLKAQQARDFAAFRKAFESFAVSAQNMMYADKAGNIGHVLATMLPVRPSEPPDDFILKLDDPAAHWRGVRDALELPSAYNPPAGFLASANNRPTFADIPIGYFFSTDDRILRMKQMIGPNKQIGVADLRALQRDTYMPSAVALRDAAVGLLEGAPNRGLDGLDAGALEAFRLMKAWDGHYRIDGKGPVAFELFNAALTQRFYDRRFEGADLRAMTGFSENKRLIATAIRERPAAEMLPLLRAALVEAGKKIGAFESWGAMHRLQLSHPLSFLPVIGDRYRFGDYPTPGSSDTLQKTAHDLVEGRHGTRYGQQARHISDMSDMDRNWFTLLGGQDGWLSSTTALDQVALWQRGRYVQVPLRLETVRKRFPHRMRLAPGEPSKPE